MLKKSQVLEEGRRRGLRDALTIIGRMLNESSYSGDQIQQWVRRLNSSHVRARGEYRFLKDERRGYAVLKGDASAFKYDEGRDALCFNVGGKPICVTSFSEEWPRLYSAYGFNGSVKMRSVEGTDGNGDAIAFLGLDVELE